MSSPLCPSGEAVGEVFGSVGGPQSLSRVEELLAGILEELRYMRALQEDVARQQREFRLDAIELIASENAENGTGFDKVIRLQVEASGIPQRIAQLEQQISMVQQSLEAESLNPANETAAAEPGAPEAK